jgi:hypothetical protein
VAAPLARLPQQVAAPVAPSPAASPAPSPEQTSTGLAIETKIPRWLLRFIRLNLSERPKVKTFRATAWNWDSLDQGTKNSSSWLAPRRTNQKKKGKEKKNGTMKGSIPRGEFEAEMEKGSEEVNPKKFAPRADLGGREGGGGKREGADGQRRRRRVVWSLPQNFESLSIIFFFYFPFPKQFLNFSPMANLFLSVNRIA